MSKLQNESFNIPEYKDIFKELYSDFLNVLIKDRYDKGYTTKRLAEMLKCSDGTISNFENRIKDHDYLMLNKYARLLRFNLTMHLSRMTYAERMSI